MGKLLNFLSDYFGPASTDGEQASKANGENGNAGEMGNDLHVWQSDAESRPAPPKGMQIHVGEEIEVWKR